MQPVTCQQLCRDVAWIRPSRSINRPFGAGCVRSKVKTLQVSCNRAECWPTIASGSAHPFPCGFRSPAVNHSGRQPYSKLRAQGRRTTLRPTNAPLSCLTESATCKYVPAAMMPVHGDDRQVKHRNPDQRSTCSTSPAGAMEL